MKTIITTIFVLFLINRLAIAQDTMYVYKSGAVSTKLAIVNIDSVIFYKASTTQNNTPSQSDLMTQSVSDDLAIRDAQLVIDIDVTNFMSGLSVTKGNGDTIPCGLKVIDSNKVKKKFHISYYNGVNCDINRVKTGDITIQLINGTQWNEAGAEIQVNYNVSVTRKVYGKIYTLKGVKTITNVNGGLIWGRTIDINNIITHVVDGKDTITFPDGTTRIWEHKVQRTWQQYIAHVWTLTITGLGTSGSYDYLATWGVNRKGDNFYSQIKTPIVSINACYWLYPSKGEIIHTIVSTKTSETASITVTLGVDANGNPPSVNTCASSYKINWIAQDGKSGTNVLSY